MNNLKVFNLDIIIIRVSDLDTIANGGKDGLSWYLLHQFFCFYFYPLH